MTTITRRTFLKLVAGTAAALGLGPHPAPVAETPGAEDAPRWRYGHSAMMENGNLPTTLFKNGVLYVTYATAAPDRTVTVICEEEHTV